MPHMYGSTCMNSSNGSFYVIAYLGLKEINGDRIKDSIRNTILFHKVRNYYYSNNSIYKLQIEEKTEELYQNFLKRYKSRELENLINLLEGNISIDNITDKELTALNDYVVLLEDMVSFLCIKYRGYESVVRSIKEKFEKTQLGSSKFLYIGGQNESYLKLLTKKIISGTIKVENVTPEMLLQLEKVYSTYNPSLRSNNKYADYRAAIKELKIGRSLELDKDIYHSEVMFILKSIQNDSEFEQKYHHKFDLIDMYLTTCAKSEDVQLVYKKEFVPVFDFLRAEFRKAYIATNPNLISLNTLKSYELHTSCQEFYGDLDAQVKTPNSLETYSKEEFKKVQDYLLRLNYRYALPISKATIICMINAVKGGYYKEYFNVAKDFKEKLDEYSEINGHSNPFTRYRRKKDN